MASFTQAENKLASDPLVDQLPLGICLVDRDFDIVNWNHTLERWTGQRGDEVIGHNLLALFPNLHGADIRAQLEQVFESGEPVCLADEEHCHFIPARAQVNHAAHDSPSRQSPAKRPDPLPQQSQLMVQRTTIQRHNSQPNLALITIEDVTSSDLNRQHYVEQQERLEAMSQQLATIRQQHAEFVANMSQELRVPLNSIFGYSEFLRDHETIPEHRAALDGMRRNGEKLATVINDALDFTKIEARQLRINMERFELEPLLNDIVSLIRLAAVEQGISFECELDPQLPASMESDPIRLRQILLNLLTNAVTFTDSGKVTLAVKINDTPSGRVIEFQVIDTGKGISPVGMQQLFHPFRRSSDEISPRKRGTGLGLAISNPLAFLLGARLAAESRVDEGSTFALSLPEAPVANSNSAAGLAAALAQKNTETNRAIVSTSEQSLSGRILLVEDSTDNQRIIAHFLQCAGANVDVASDGVEALEKIAALEAEGETYDFVLMDMQMPRMDGYEATQALRNQGYENPIVAITAHSVDYDMNRCREAGCTDYTTKPVQRKSLIDLVARHLKDSMNDILPFNRLGRR